MNTKLNRRSFLKQSALAAGVLSAAPFNILHAANAGDKVRCVQIGCGGRGMSHIDATLNEAIIALVDPDEKKHDSTRKRLGNKGQTGSKVQAFPHHGKP